MSAKLEVSKTETHLVIHLPLQKPTLSASGKTKVVGSTHGNVPTTVDIDGQPVIIGVNAYIRK